MRAMNLAPDVLVTACGTAGTQTGLILGSLLFAQGQIRVVGISVSGKAEALRARIKRNLEEAISFLGLKLFVPEELIEVYDDYVGPGYAVPTPEMRKAVELLARKEGILLDPVYTGKAMAGLLDLAEKGAFGGAETLVFLHTGGVPALFSDSQAPFFYPAGETSGLPAV
jgi:D-cysteine desulfhydrase